MLKDAKASYYSSIISENASHPKVLFNAVDKLLNRKVERRSPTPPSTIELTNKFTDFFDKKIATIRTKLSNEAKTSTQSWEANKKPGHAEFKEFRVMSEREIEGFVDTIGKKFCDLDPILAAILKDCKSALLPVLINIVNMSFQSASMPAALKEAAIKPKLKKDNLDSKDYSNFRPISNLKGRDIFLNLPTDYGKSLIFQALPTMFDVVMPRQGSIVVVVCPLLNLSKDQAAYLNSLGTSAINISDVENEGDPRDVEAGKYPLVYGTPESWLDNDRWGSMLTNKVYSEKLCAIAVDEAHVIRQW
ncbi:ATP-dependent DNA helicase Q1 [Stylophora pistillata]|uniref:ATP-dependent DNA helicase Q1 n=1 Tax=Stylophora pistillata TaxID=50429 RepID=A0A2B4S670_STYPI|nr:ATP-dependent DNA helicase Q1 [Stylophora pistillata]